MKKYSFSPIEPSSINWQIIENCYDGTVDKTEGIMRYCIQQGCKPFVVSISNVDNCIGYFVGTIIRRAGLKIIGSPNEGLGIAHQGLCMIEEISVTERLDIYKSFANWAFKNRYGQFIQIEDFQLRIKDVQDYSDIKFQGHDCSWIDLTQTEDEILHNMEYKSCRYMINKAIKNGYYVREAHDPYTFLDLHFKQHIEVMKRHNKSAEKPKKNMKWLIDSTLGSSLLILEAVSPEGEVVVTAIFNVNHQNAHFFSRACYSKDLSSGANELIMWEAMKRCKEKGAKWFNNSGCGKFKLKFGAIREYKPRLFFAKYDCLISARQIAFNIYHKNRWLFNFMNNR